jgi:transcriptional regulator with XRE-family HTH domain
MSNIRLVDYSNRWFDSFGMAIKKRHRKNYIRQLREARGWTLQDVADKVGVKNPHISMLENGARGLSVEMLYKLAQAFEVHPLEITEGPVITQTPAVAEAQLLKVFRDLPPDKQNLYLSLGKTFVREEKSAAYDTPLPKDPKKK